VDGVNLIGISFAVCQGVKRGSRGFPSPPALAGDALLAYIGEAMIAGNHIEAAEPVRDTRAALLRGWARRCPACGKGAMMDGYLGVRNACPHCETEFFHHRADDGPAWATILITGHLMAPLMLIVFTAFRPPGWVLALGFSVAFVALSLWLLPRLKGAFVALQWAKRMHGFGGEPVRVAGG
jgi:uncharacterized protein (DUF983 family)